jgi:hypothetical protein
MEVTQSGNYPAIFVPDSARYYSSEEVQVRVTARPELNSLPDSLTGFITLNGTASPTQSVSINGTNLTSDVVVSFPGEKGFEVSKNPMGNFTTSVILPVTSGTVSVPLYVRLAASAAIGNDKVDQLVINSSGISTSVTLSGDVIDSSLSYISVTPEDLTLPFTTAGTPSASANFTVNAFNLSGNLTANATTGFEISLGNGTFSQTLEIPLTGGNITNALLNLRVAASASAEMLPGSVTLTSGSTTATVSVNGTVGKAPPPPPPPTSTSTSTPVCKCKKNPKVKKSQKCKCGIESNQQKGKNKQKKKKKSVFTFPQVAATSGSTWITADGRVVSENQRPQSNTSK